MFNRDFYPSPQHVIDILLDGIDLHGKTVLEPSAGSGAIVKALQHAGAKEVLACENDPQLVKITQSLCRVIESDFLKLTSDKVSHIDYIIMNPPFSRGVDHILHAYNIAPAGCQIITLCNSETIKNRYSKSREELGTLVDTYGQSQDLGDCFSTAERKTEVKVSLIRLQKPGESANEFEGFFMNEDPTEEQVNGLMSYNVVRDLVNRYVESIKIYDEQLKTAVKLNDMMGDCFDWSDRDEDEKGGYSVTISSKGVPVARNEFKKRLQKAGWRYIFNKMKLTKHTTQGLKEELNKFVEKQDSVPFTMRNIYHMLDLVMQTTGQRMDKAILEAFDRITSYHDGNKHGLPGWKTNSHYLLTQRFIVPNMAQVGYDGNIDASYSSNNFELIEDLQKAICYVTGQDYNDMLTIQDYLDYHYFLVDKDGNFFKAYANQIIKERDHNRIVTEQIKRPGSIILDLQKGWGKWFDAGLFKIRCYKKGTMHLEFKSQDTWALFNQRVAKIKGYPLPEKREQTAYQKKQTYQKPVQPMQTRAGKEFKKTAPQKPVILSTIQI